MKHKNKSQPEPEPKEIPNQGRHLVISTPSRSIIYNEEDFQQYNIYFDLYSDGGDPNSFTIKDNIPKIIDGSWNPGSDKTKDNQDRPIGLRELEYTTEITNPNWKIIINIGQSITEGGRGFMDDARTRTPITMHVFCYASDGRIMTERTYEKLAWYERHKFGRELKQTTTVIQPIKEEVKA